MIEKELLIGRSVVKIRSNHPGYEGIHGTIVDETMKTLIIEMRGKEFMVPKAGNSFALKSQDRLIWIDGKKILYRPEDRIKKVR